MSQWGQGLRVPEPVTGPHTLPDVHRLARGPVPRGLPDVLLRQPGFVASSEAFLIEMGELRFHYRRGIGVHYAAPLGTDEVAIRSVHQGSVFGAAAWMNSLMPLHASAVNWNGQVHAFAGASGAGKSTLAAALQKHGFVMHADDVLALCVDENHVPLALAGHKQLRLWADALELTGYTGSEPVWPGVNKFFVGTRPTGRGAALPLGSLTIIEDAIENETRIENMKGVERIIAVRDVCYRPEYRLPHQETAAFKQIAAIANMVPIYRFARFRDRTCFASSVRLVAEHIRGVVT